VVRSGHQLQEERLLPGVIGIGQLEGLPVQVLVGHAPGILETDFAFIDAALVDDAVAVAAEKRIHVVEVAAPAVDEYRVIAFGGQLLAETGVVAFAADALDDRAARGRRDRQGDGFQAAVGTGAGGIEIVEVQALAAQGIEVRREVARIAVTAHVLGAEAFDGHQDDVGRALLTVCTDVAADVLGFLALELCIGFGQLLMHLRADFAGAEAGVELGVVQFVVTEGGEELVRAVAGQLALIGIAALAAWELLVDHHAVQADQYGQHSQPGHALTRGGGRAGEGLDQWLAQHQGKQDRSQRDAAEQCGQWVGFADVVQHFLGIDQVVDGDEVEAYAEFVPEQPLGHGNEQHHEQADHQQAAKQPMVGTRAPQSVWAQRQVQAQRQGRVDEEAQVVDRPVKEDRKIVAAELIHMSEQQ